MNRSLIYVLVAVTVALTANIISAIWASKDNKFSLWLLAVVLISPLVFITFGLVTSRLGVSATSATVDSLLTITTIIAGLLLFHERDYISIKQYLGIFLSLCGIVLMHFSK